VATLYVQSDGVYVQGPGGEVLLDGAAILIRSDSGVTVRFHPQDVVIRQQPVNAQVYDYRGRVALLALAVARGGLTIAEIAAVSPARAALVNQYLSDHGWTPGSVD
jgi:hypothetical protein